MLDPLGMDVLLVVDIDSPNPVIQTFASDLPRNPAAGGDPIQMSAPAVQVVPEPTTLALLVIGLAVAGLLVAKRRG